MMRITITNHHNHSLKSPSTSSIIIIIINTVIILLIINLIIDQLEFHRARGGFGQQGGWREQAELVSVINTIIMVTVIIVTVIIVTVIIVTIIIVTVIIVTVIIFTVIIVTTRVVGDSKSNSMEGRRETIKRNPDTLPQVFVIITIIIMIGVMIVTKNNKL